MLIVLLRALGMKKSCRSANTHCNFILVQHLNGIKAEYDAWLIEFKEGDQFGSGFVEINPNSKIPALLDVSEQPAVRVFESGAILQYLAEKFEHFLPTQRGERAECLSWLFWNIGSAPFLGGGFGHFYKYAPENRKTGVSDQSVYYGS